MNAQHAPLIVVFGVSGSGKTTVGTGLADELGVPFIDADALHPASNVAKMASGTPLDDDDRRPWLARVGDELARARRAGTGLVMACSALKRDYRDLIRAAAGGVTFVHLDGEREVLARRTQKRSGHFMPPSLLDSQLATLEPLQPDEAGVVVDISPSPAEVVTRARALIAADVA
ncbi:gluconokinase [Microbacterium protaetiae]|uniref:Gluconokinase n=1 Tax=Microbacterium protaetiae TaxID=2509458 RepID=A0A4P6EBZ6_9MICO|nr:gluconokinase [Microbacterium protaetiae]QAY59740.1 gluconokinase [Microbacterium protaetiae]